MRRNARLNPTAQDAKVGRIAPKQKPQTFPTKRESAFLVKWFTMMDRVFGIPVTIGKQEQDHA